MIFNRCSTAKHREKLDIVNIPQSPSLQELIDLAMSQRDTTSIRHLTQLAQDHGFKVVHTTLGQIRNGTYKYKPREETLKAIAWLAGVEESVAFTAAGQPVPGPPLADELPPGADNLSPKSRKAIVDMVRVLVDLETSNHAQPTDHAEPQRKLRAVDTDSDHPGKEQKTEPGEYTITEIHGDETANYPAPPIEQLAAHPKVKTTQELLDETTGERDDGGEAE